MENTMVKIKLFVKEIRKDNQAWLNYSTVDKDGKWWKVIKANNGKQLPEKSCVIGLIDKKFAMKENVTKRNKDGTIKMNSNGDVIKENILWIDDYNYEGEIEREHYNEEDLPF